MCAQRSGKLDPPGRRNERSKRPVQPPFPGKVAKPGPLQPIKRRHGGFEFTQRRFCGQLSASQRESQTVARHRVDKTGRIACEQKAGASGSRRFDRERTECHDVRDPPGAGKPFLHDRFARNGVCDVVAHMHIRSVSLTGQLSYDADVRDAVTKRCDPQIATAADVHLSASGQPIDVAEVGAKRPSPRRSHKSRQSEEEP